MKARISTENKPVKEKPGRLCYRVQLNAADCRHQRPVRCMLDRDEDMIITGKRHPFATKYRVLVATQSRLNISFGFSYLSPEFRNWIVAKGLKDRITVLPHLKRLCFANCLFVDFGQHGIGHLVLRLIDKRSEIREKRVSVGIGSPDHGLPGQQFWSGLVGSGLIKDVTYSRLGVSLRPALLSGDGQPLFGFQWAITSVV